MQQIDHGPDGVDQHLFESCLESRRRRHPRIASANGIELDYWTECSAPPLLDDVDQAMVKANDQCTIQVTGFQNKLPSQLYIPLHAFTSSLLCASTASANCPLPERSARTTPTPSMSLDPSKNCKSVTEWSSANARTGLPSFHKNDCQAILKEFDWRFELSSPVFSNVHKLYSRECKFEF